ncbi:unnamed protein product [Rodentolepis nana]|uniref:RUN domain-containing protein n=1 Tax=Rodentolepis nana TaxID=102285 RepID=A0A158QJE0_RODNA|nr:unnamed protein product [Rodentolepis nana]
MYFGGLHSNINREALSGLLVFYECGELLTSGYFSTWTTKKDPEEEEEEAVDIGKSTGRICINSLLSLTLLTKCATLLDWDNFPLLLHIKKKADAWHCQLLSLGVSIPPPPLCSVASFATAESTAVLEKVGQKLGGGGTLYDDAWDLRMARFGLQTASSLTKSNTKSEAKKEKNPPGGGQQGGRGPPDGAATCESTCSLTSASSTISTSSKVMDDESTTSNGCDSEASKGMSTTVTTSVNNTISTFTSSAANSVNKVTVEMKSTPSCNGDVVPPPISENDTVDGISTPTPCNNSNWFPPPPPTPLHLALQTDGDSTDSQPGRYHEHRRSFEMDDETEHQGLTKMDSSGDAITIPPLSPLPPPQEGGRASVASFLLNLPPPPPVTDLANEDIPSPPAIPPRDPKTSVTTPNSETLC